MKMKDASEVEIKQSEEKVQAIFFLLHGDKQRFGARIRELERGMHADRDEWTTTVGYGAISIPIGYFMRLFPVSEDPDSFAGLPGKMDAAKKDSSSWLRFLVLALIPLLAAIVYQLAREVEELKH